MGLVLILAYVAVTHESDHHPRREGRPMALGQQMREVSHLSQIRILSHADGRCYRTSFSTSPSLVHGSTYQFIGFTLLILMAPSLLTFIHTTFMQNGRDLQALSVYCKLF
jgi:hypothetical protein